MKRYFTALLLLSLLTAFPGCEMLESIVPKPDQSAAPVDTTGVIACFFVKEVGVDTITQGSYLGFTIGQPATSSYAVMQQLRKQEKFHYLSTISREVWDVAQLEETLPLYNVLSLRQDTATGPSVSIHFVDGKVSRIEKMDVDMAFPTQWPAPEPASAAVALGDPVETVAGKLLSLKDKPPYADFFKFIRLSEKDLTRGYDPYMTSLPEWDFYTLTGTSQGDNVRLQFRQGSLRAIYVRHLLYY